MEKYEARTQQTDKGIHLQKGTGGQGEWLTQQPSAPHTHLSALVEQRLGEQKEGGRHHMAQEPVPVPSALLSGFPAPGHDLYAFHANGPTSCPLGTLPGVQRRRTQ